MGIFINHGCQTIKNVSNSDYLKTKLLVTFIRFKKLIGSFYYLNLIKPIRTRPKLN